MTRGKRGGNFREKGEEFVETIIKDTWTIMGVGCGNTREVWSCLLYTSDAADDWLVV